MSTGHMLAVLAVVWTATGACVFLLGHSAGVRAGWDRARRARVLQDRLEDPVYLAGPPFAGAQDSSYRLEGCNHAALLDDAIAIAERQQDWRDAHREAAAIWAEVEADPEKWRHRP